jgi:hypothetical protein
MVQAGIRYQNCIDSRDQTSADHPPTSSPGVHACQLLVCIWQPKRESDSNPDTAEQRELSNLSVLP